MGQWDNFNLDSISSKHWPIMSIF